MKKIIKILLVVLFPLGALYCIGRALFNDSGFSGFFGCLLLAGAGILFGMYLVDPLIFQKAIAPIVDLFSRL